MRETARRYLAGEINKVVLWNAQYRLSMATKQHDSRERRLLASYENEPHLPIVAALRHVADTVEIQGAHVQSEVYELRQEQAESLAALRELIAIERQRDGETLAALRQMVVALGDIAAAIAMAPRVAALARAGTPSVPSPSRPSSPGSSFRSFSQSPANRRSPVVQSPPPLPEVEPEPRPRARAGVWPRGTGRGAVRGSSPVISRRSTREGKRPQRFGF